MYIRIYWKLILWSLIMTIILLVPSNKLPDGPVFPFSDKIIHVFLFAVFAFLLMLGRYNHARNRVFALWPVIAMFLISTAFGAILELAQSIMALGREGSITDIFADAAGFVPGWLSAIWFIKKSGSVS
jgi:VanZ family protein